jgi:hypothetical protein
MQIVGNIYISDDVIEEAFVCDLIQCKGACCVEGDLGAPLEKEETKILAQILDKVRPYLTKAGLSAIEQQGAFIRDEEGDFSTTTIDGKECAYSFYDTRGILKCGIEQAYLDGKTDFPKPISCHLYPIRVTKLAEEEALNYHRWHICEPACQLGKSLQVPIYRFLKNALIRKYGEEWYQALQAQVEASQSSEEK